MEHHARTQNETLEVKTTTCYMCACRCGIRVHLREGSIAGIPAEASSPKAIIKMRDCAGFTLNFLPGAAEKFAYDSNRCCFYCTTYRVCGIAWICSHSA